MIVENLEEITTTQNMQETLSNKLKSNYDSVLLIQQNNNKSLQEELENVTPDENRTYSYLS